MHVVCTVRIASSQCMRLTQSLYVYSEVQIKFHDIKNQNRTKRTLHGYGIRYK